MTTRSHALALYRSLLRNANKINNYNFRLHALRRTKSHFQESRHLSQEEANIKYAWGLEQLKLLERQKILGTLYPDVANVIEQR